MTFKSLRMTAAVALGAAALMTAPAQALTFNLTNIGGAGQGTSARLGFDIATKYWSSVLTDNVTVNLQIGFGRLGPNILGSTSSNSQVAYVSDVYRMMDFDQTSNLDAAANFNLPALRGSALALDVVVNNFADTVNRAGYTDTSTRLDRDRSSNNAVLDVNTANLKALGFTVDANGTPIDQTYDGRVVFSNQFNFDFNPSNGVTGIDFIGVAIHEIGHALGFVSGVDTYDLFTSPGSPNYGTVNGVPLTYAQALQMGILIPGETNLENFAIGSTLDLFRYNTAGQLDWSTSSGEKIFSVDGTSRVYGDGSFSLGAFNGDGNQASHWLEPADQSTREGACSNFLGIMNPYICSNQGDAVTSLDLAAMDVIGWNLATNVRDNANYSFSTADAFNAFAPVPEPATWAEMIFGMSGIGALLRRRKQQRSVLA